MSDLVVATFMVVVANRVVEYIAAPLKQKFTFVDFWWLLYVAIGVGALLTWFSGVNLFAAYIPSPMIGKVLTAIVAGGGSDLLYDLFDTGAK